MHYMNPQRAKHMGQEHGGSHEAPVHGKSEAHESGGGKHPHSIHIHHAGSGEPHAGAPHHVHVHHSDGSHEHSDHQNFDEAMSHAQSMGGEAGQGHGEDQEQPEGDEFGVGL